MRKLLFLSVAHALVLLAVALLSSCATPGERYRRIIEREITGPLPPDPGWEAIEAQFREQEQR